MNNSRMQIIDPGPYGRSSSTAHFALLVATGACQYHRTWGCPIVEILKHSNRSGRSFTKDTVDVEVATSNADADRPWTRY